MLGYRSAGVGCPPEIALIEIARERPHDSKCDGSMDKGS
jgi:hypothetical protein